MTRVGDQSLDIQTHHDRRWLNIVCDTNISFLFYFWIWYMEFMSEQILKAVRKSDISNRYILSYITLLIWVWRFLELYKTKKCVKMTLFSRTFNFFLLFFCFTEWWTQCAKNIWWYQEYNPINSIFNMGLTHLGSEATKEVILTDTVFIVMKYVFITKL